MNNDLQLAQLQQGLTALRLEYTTETLQLFYAYLRLLAKWNRIYNLTAIPEKEWILYHILDSLAVLPYLKGDKALDVGSGAGLPGMILAIADSHRHWTLLDSSKKKTRFLTQTCLELKLNHVEVAWERIENYQPAQLFTTIISRAYTNLTAFYQQTVHLCAAEGILLAMKGKMPTAELAALRHLPIALESVPLHIPNLQAERHLIILKPQKQHF